MSKYLSLFLLAVAPLFSATNGVISGTVNDTSGAVVPNAPVTIVNSDKGATVWRGKSNESGIFRAPNLTEGVYSVTVDLPGFKKAIVERLTLSVDQRADIKITLEPGAAAEAITVSGDAVTQLGTDSSSVGSLISTTQVQNLPLPSRNILNLLSLTPGVSSGGDATGINANQLSINGSRTLNSEFMVDGISVVSGSTGGVQTLPAADAIREFKVLTSAYSAEYGRTSGAVVTLVINSGANQYHGGLYYYFRNEDLNANNFFFNTRGQARPRDRYNLFGGKFSGPVFLPKLYNGHDKTFFFFNYEGLRQSSPYANISSVPTAAFRAGDFSSSAIPVFDPISGMQFPGNRIPVNRIDPAAAKILSVLPQANSPGTPDAVNGRVVNNLVQSGSSKPGSNNFTTRVDQNFGINNRLYGTLTHFKATSPLQSVIPGPLESAVGPTTTTGYQAALNFVHTWTPTLLTEARVGYFRNNSAVVPPSAGLNVAADLGVARSVGNASPAFNISGLSGYGLNTNTLRSQIDNNFQTAISSTKVLGNHLIKFGFDLRKNQFNVFNPGAYTGTYTFNGELTSATRTSGNPINALADFLLGSIKTASYILPQPPAGRRNYNTGIYAQDDWKVTPKLTVNLGLRWEYESPMTSSNGVYSRVDPATGQVLFAGKNASDSLNLVGKKTNFAPRVGMAYSLDSKTVIRSGFGIFYSQIFSDLGGVVLFPGFTVSQSFPNLGTGIAQPFTLSQGFPLVASQNLQNPQANLSQYSPSNTLGGSASFGEINPFPYAAEWNFGLQRQLPFAVVLEANYVGSAGVHLPVNLPYNQVPFSQGTELARANTAVTTQNARPYPSIGGFSATEMASHSSYHGLQVSARRQFGRLGFVANYTRSKSINDSDGLFSFSQPTGLNSGQFPNQFRFLDRALSEFDRPNNFTGAVQYRTGGPRWLRDFEINPIITARDGLPLTINQNNLNPAANQLRPNVISQNSIYLPNAVPNGSGVQYLVPANSASFPYGPVGPLFTGTGATRTLILPAGIGTLGRNTVRAPGEFDLDLAVDRRFQITERFSLQARAEAFNLLNHTNFLPPDTTLSVIASPTSGLPVFNSPAFGLITASRAARFLQLALRLQF